MVSVGFLEQSPKEYQVALYLSPLIRLLWISKPQPYGQNQWPDKHLPEDWFWPLG